MEMKKRFKMYKDGKRWVIGLASAAFIMGLGVASNTASADQVKNNTDNSLELVDGVNKGSIDVDNKQSQQDTNSIKNKTDDSTNSESQTSSLSNPDIKSSNEESKNEKQEALDQQDNNNVNATPENKDSSDVENKTISDATNKVDKPMESSNTDSSDNSISGSSQNDESTPVNMPASSGHVYSDPETVKKFLIWQSIPSKNGDGTINPYAPIIINWNWELGDLKKGDTVNFNIDTTLFTIANDTSAPILTSDGTSVGTFSVTKGGDASVLLSDPSDYFASHTGVNGLLNLITKASEKVVNTPGGEFTFNTTIAKTPFTVSNDSSGTVKDKEYLVKFSTNVGDKWVSPDGTVYESDITTGKIHWHTDINSIKDSLENVSVIDSPEDTQKIDFSSLIVTKFDENGIAKLVSSDQYVLNQTDGGGFTLQLGNITDHYGIDYMSNLVDINGDGMFNDDSQVTNTISLTGNHPVTSQVDTFINTSASGNAEGNTPTTPPTVPTTPPTVPTTPPTVPTTPPTVPTTPPTVPTTPPTVPTTPPTVPTTPPTVPTTPPTVPTTPPTVPTTPPTVPTTPPTVPTTPPTVPTTPPTVPTTPPTVPTTPPTVPTTPPTVPTTPPTVPTTPPTVPPTPPTVPTTPPTVPTTPPTVPTTPPTVPTTPPTVPTTPPTVPTTPPTVPTTPPTVPTTPPTVPTTPPTVPTTPPTVPTTPPTAPAKQLNKKLPQTGEDSDDGILLIIGELLGAIGLLGALKKKKN